MKKTARIVLVIVFVFGIILASAPQYALAKSNPLDPTSTVTPRFLIAGGSWVSGSEADVTAQVSSAPTWLQWLANGVKITEAGKICHPLRGGQFGWVGIIMQYKNGQWVKLATTNDWVPNKEGEFMACAQAPAAGTYALFGYWKRPAGYIEGSSAASVCNSISWNDVTVVVDTGVIFNGYVVPVTPPITVSFTVTDSSDDTLKGRTGTYNVTSSDGNFWGGAGFSADPGTTLTVIFTESSNNCTSGEMEFTIPEI